MSLAAVLLCDVLLIALVFGVFALFHFVLPQPYETGQTSHSLFASSVSAAAPASTEEAATVSNAAPATTASAPETATASAPATSANLPPARARRRRRRGVSSAADAR